MFSWYVRVVLVVSKARCDVGFIKTRRLSPLFVCSAQLNGPLTSHCDGTLTSGRLVVRVAIADPRRSKAKVYVSRYSRLL